MTELPERLSPAAQVQLDGYLARRTTQLKVWAAIVFLINAGVLTAIYGMLSSTAQSVATTAAQARTKDIEKSYDDLHAAVQLALNNSISDFRTKQDQLSQSYGRAMAQVETANAEAVAATKKLEDVLTGIGKLSANEALKKMQDVLSLLQKDSKVEEFLNVKARVEAELLDLQDRNEKLTRQVTTSRLVVKDVWLLTKDRLGQRAAPEVEIGVHPQWNDGENVDVAPDEDQVLATWWVPIDNESNIGEFHRITLEPGTKPNQVRVRAMTRQGQASTLMRIRVVAWVRTV